MNCVETKHRWMKRLYDDAFERNLSLIIHPDTKPVEETKMQQVKHLWSHFKKSKKKNLNPEKHLTGEIGKMMKEGYTVVIIHKRVRGNNLNEILRRGRDRSKCNGR